MNAISDQKAMLAEALLSADATAPAAAPSMAPWAARWRDDARRRFAEMGAPVKRDEYWRYTDPAKLTRPMATASSPAASAAIAGPFAAAEPATLVFENGVYRPDLSDDLSALDVEIRPLAEALQAEGWASEALGALETRGQSPVPRPMAALNGAFARDGVVLRVGARVSRPIHIRYVGGGGAAYARHLVKLDPGAEAVLLESGAGADRLNTVLEVDIADGAAFHHVRSQAEAGPDGQLTTAVFARLGAEARFKSFTLRPAGFAGAAVSRNEAVIWLEGDAGSAHIAGATLGAGSAVADNTVFLTHDAVDCESRQVFKTVLDDASQGVFQGKILVKAGAQKTDGYQISQSLLLSDGAEFDAKPELEIYADDVKCSHGSTTSSPDPTALFYLRSRGVPEAAAQALLVAAFVDEAVSEIASDALQEAMRAEIADWMTARRERRA